MNTYTPDEIASMRDEKLQALYDELTDECRVDLAALNAKVSFKETVRRELHGRMKKPAA